jgi:hypothetical protein
MSSTKLQPEQDYVDLPQQYSTSDCRLIEE